MVFSIFNSMFQLKVYKKSIELFPTLIKAFVLKGFFSPFVGKGEVFGV